MMVDRETALRLLFIVALVLAAIVVASCSSMARRPSPLIIEIPIESPEQ